MAASYPATSTPKPRPYRKRTTYESTPTPPVKRKLLDPVSTPDHSDVYLPTESDNVTTLPVFQEILDLNYSQKPSDECKTPKLQKQNFIHKVTENDKECFYYVGIPTIQLLHFLFSWIEPAAKKFKNRL